MCKIQCLLAFLALSFGAVHSWDIAITIGDQLELYTNQTKTTLKDGQFRDLTALAYDAVHNMLLFVDSQNDSASIFIYHFLTKKYQSLVRRRAFESIQGLAFDPVTMMLFWTDFMEKSIFWMSLKPDSKNSPYGNLLFKMDNEIPRGIAVDSCRGYVYWTNTNVTRPTIERARFDGSDREIIIDTDIYMPVSLVIDQKTKRLVWADDKEGIHYSIESSDLQGKNRYTILTGISHEPNGITLSKDAIYWTDWGYKTIWKLPRGVPDSLPLEFKAFSDKPIGIVANYDIAEQTEGVPQCEKLRSLANNRSTLNVTLNVPPEMGRFCLHGSQVKDKMECQCINGYSGERCDISVCHNYCFSGDCSINSDGTPSCRCDTGHKGKRCEVNVCDGYCLNNGFCSFDDKSEPQCQCLTDHEGSRCETMKVFTTNTSELPVTVKVATSALLAEPCNCTQNDTRNLMFLSDQLSPNDEFVPASCDMGWDAVRDPIIMVLGVLCGLLCLSCAFLITKILQLKKRPRIKKRIIINKNLTPMTARPDQCEITIENCCNMNICETPCFEPQSTIRPLRDAKPGKEEKKNLIANMEYPDDY